MKLGELYARIRSMPDTATLCNVNRNGQLWWGFQLTPSPACVMVGPDKVAYRTKPEAQRWVRSTRGAKAIADAWQQLRFDAIEEVARACPDGGRDQNQEIPPRGLALGAAWGIVTEPQGGGTCT